MGGPTDVTMVVLGAGASHDCLRRDWSASRQVTGPDAGFSPFPFPLQLVRSPLTKDLVAETPFLNAVVRKYGRCLPVVSWLRQRLAEADGPDGGAPTLERALAEYSRDAGDNDAVKRHLVAFRFYLCEVLWRVSEYMRSDELGGGDTNYQPLVRQLYEWSKANGREVCVVNFNYDLLFETACANYWGFKMHKMSAYVDHPKIKVIKPHGSVNWLTEFVGRPEGVPLINWADASIDRGDQDLQTCARGADGLAPWADASHRGVTFRAAGAPALAPPIADKADFVCPADQLDYLRSLVPGGVSQMLVIGWRAAEPRSLEILESAVRDRSRVHVVDLGTGGSDAESSLGQKLASPVFSRSTESFREYMAGPMFQAWLGSSEKPRSGALERRSIRPLPT